ncbi:MAG TPA: hypothetical protein VKB09_10290, partial [Thermomicrobiales bacterium]|nr:hypothetical protein [Thermomicrobiales bacterium]
MEPGRFAEAADLFDALFALPGADGDPALLVSALQTAGGLAHWLGNHGRALELYAQARERYERLGDRRGVALSLRGSGSVAIDQGQPPAHATPARGAAIGRRRSDRPGDRGATLHLAADRVEPHRGRAGEARGHLSKGRRGGGSKAGRGTERGGRALRTGSTSISAGG